jgi:hypothetical protein
VDASAPAADTANGAPDIELPNAEARGATTPCAADQPSPIASAADSVVFANRTIASGSARISSAMRAA